MSNIEKFGSKEPIPREAQKRKLLKRLQGLLGFIAHKKVEGRNKDPNIELLMIGAELPKILEKEKKTWKLPTPETGLRLKDKGSFDAEHLGTRMWGELTFSPKNYEWDSFYDNILTERFQHTEEIQLQYCGEARSISPNWHYSFKNYGKTLEKRAAGTSSISINNTALQPVVDEIVDRKFKTAENHLQTGNIDVIDLGVQTTQARVRSIRFLLISTPPELAEPYLNLAYLSAKQGPKSVVTVRQLPNGTILRSWESNQQFVYTELEAGVPLNIASTLSDIKFSLELKTKGFRDGKYFLVALPGYRTQPSNSPEEINPRPFRAIISDGENNILYRDFSLPYVNKSHLVR